MRFATMHAQQPVLSMLSNVGQVVRFATMHAQQPENESALHLLKN